MLQPVEGGNPGSTAQSFAEQEASFLAEASAAAACAIDADDAADRPLTGAKPPSALDAASDGVDRPLTGGGGGGKGAWEPPSEFPPGQGGGESGTAGRVEERAVARAEGAVEKEKDAEGGASSGGIPAEYMTALG